MRLTRDIKDKHNLAKRKARRMCDGDEFNGRTLFRTCPTITELKEALRNPTESHFSIIRLAALMDNLSAYEAPRLHPIDKDCRGRTKGIRTFLAQNGYLLSRYACLMRYKKLGEQLRKAADIQDDVDLLWGLGLALPEDPEYAENDIEILKALYSSLEGLNFREILNVLNT